MPKPNYSFEKRQRELAKKQKKEAKALEKSARKDHASEGDETQAATAQPPQTDASAPSEPAAS